MEYRSSSIEISHHWPHVPNHGDMTQLVGKILNGSVEAKSFSSDVTESQVIADFAGYDLLIIDEVGVQTGTDAESKALFDVFNERYQNLKPTVLISNLDAEGFVQAVGRRIADRVKEDGGEILSFDWESHRA